MQKDAITVALKFLSIRPRSAFEVARKLASKGFSPSEADSTVGALKKTGYLDDERFARTLLDSRVRNKNWGAAKISAELHSKGVPEDIIKGVISGLDSSIEEGAARSALEKWMRKNRARAPFNRDMYAKAFRFLKGRGFSTTVISGVFDGFKNSLEEQ